MGADEMGMTESEMKTLVNKWRSANGNIVRFWYDTEDKARTAIENPGSIQYGTRGIEFQMIHDTLFIKLPSGRRLAYKNAHLTEGAYKTEIRYDGKDQASGQSKWTKLKTYGGKLVENITQAVARDCLGHALLALEKAGYMPSFHVHDEVVIEVPIEQKEAALAEITKLMALDLPWTKGLPLTADAYETPYYLKD
jgi:DNA polymerase